MSRISKPTRCTSRTRSRRVQYGLLLCLAAAVASTHSGCATTQPLADCTSAPYRLTQGGQCTGAEQASPDLDVAPRPTYLDCPYPSCEAQSQYQNIDAKHYGIAWVDTDEQPDLVNALMQDMTGGVVAPARCDDETRWHQQMRIMQTTSAEEGSLDLNHANKMCSMLFAFYEESQHNITLSPLMQLAAVGWNVSPCQAISRAQASLRAAHDAIAPILEALPWQKPALVQNAYANCF